jgi:glycosyltransferase involved in cell wall biosynthesis
VPEVVFEGRTGKMVEPGDPNELAKAIVDLWADPETCRRMGDEGRRMMEERFDKQRQFDAFLSVFGRLSGAVE